MARHKYILVAEGLNVVSRKEVAEAVKLANAWWHHLSDAWFIVDSEDFHFWHNILFPVFEKHKARFMLVELPETNRVNGRLPTKAWEWIREWIKT